MPKLPVVAQSPSHGKMIACAGVPLANDSGSSKSMLLGLLAVIGSIAGLALLGWLTVVMLDLKHINTSGFTLP